MACEPHEAYLVADGSPICGRAPRRRFGTHLAAGARRRVGFLLHARRMPRSHCVHREGICSCAGHPVHYTNPTLKIYHGAWHGMCAMHKDQVDADLLSFLEGLNRRRAAWAEGTRPLRPTACPLTPNMTLGRMTIMTTATSKPAPANTTTIAEYELEQVERANATGRHPVVFIHGLWLLPSSWDRWAQVFDAAGYTALTPGRPDDPQTVADANAHPDVFSHKTIGQVADHFDGLIRRLNKKAAIIGHSFGGLLAQILAGRGLASATVAVD